MCERERERGERQKKEKNRRDLRQERKLTKILTTVIKKKKKKKTGSRQETWATEDRASAKEVQLCQTEVTYLRYTLRGKKQWLKEARKRL